VSVGHGQAAMHGEDVLLPSYRDNTPALILAWGQTGKRSCCFGAATERGKPLLPLSGADPRIFRSLHSRRIASARKLRALPTPSSCARSRAFAVCLFGERRPPPKGDVFEAMNFAGVHQACRSVFRR